MMLCKVIGVRRWRCLAWWIVTLGCFLRGADVQAASPSALLFDGRGGAVALQSTASLSGNFSVELWLKPATTRKRLPILSSSVSNAFGFSLWLEDGDKVVAQLGNGAKWLAERVEFPFEYAPSVWVHLSFRSGAGRCQLYRNGTLSGEATDLLGAILLNASHPLVLGTNRLGGSYEGVADDLKIWNTGAGANLGKFNETPATNTIGLIHHWTMDEGLGSVITDQTARRVRGILTPDVSWAPVETLLPQVLDSPTNVTLHVGSKMLLKSTSYGMPLGFQWLLEGVAIPGATNSTYAQTFTNGVGDFRYSLRVSNALGVVLGPIITVTGSPAVWTLQPADASTYVGSGASFHAALTGAAPFGYQWYFQDHPMMGATQSLLAIDSVRLEDAGDYWVTASNRWGYVTSRVARLTVPLPANDAFEHRVQLEGARTFTTGFNRGASRQAEEPGDGSGVSGRSVWWSWRAPVSGKTVISTWQSSFRTVLGVYTGEQLRALNPIEISPAPDWQGNSIQFNAIEGTTYQISVDGDPGEQGTIALVVEQSPYSISIPVLDWVSFKPGRLGMVMAAHPSGTIYMADQLGVEMLDRAGNSLWRRPDPGGAEPDNSAHIGLDEAGNCFVWSYSGSKARSTLTRYSAQGELIWTLTKPRVPFNGPEGDWIDVSPSGKVCLWNPWASYDHAGRVIYELGPCLSRGGPCDIFPDPRSIHRGSRNGITFLTSTGTEFARMNPDGGLAAFVPGFDHSIFQSVSILGYLPDDSFRVGGEYVGNSPYQRYYLKGMSASGSDLWTTRYDAYDLDGGSVSGGGSSTGVVAQDGSTYLRGYAWRTTPQPGSITTVMKVSPDGVPLWRTWCDAELENRGPIERLDSMRIGRDGSLYLAANMQVRPSTSAGFQRPLLFKFRPDGQLVFSEAIKVPDGVNIGRVTVLPTPEDHVILAIEQYNPVGTWVMRFTQPRISDYPGLSQFPKGATVWPGTNYVFSVGATNSGEVEYQWLKDGVNIPGATSARLRLSSVTLSDAGIYSVRASNALGVVQVPEARLRVIDRPSIQGTPQSGPGWLNVEAKGSAPLRFQWFFGGSLLDGETNDWCCSDRTAFAWGEYSVRVQNDYGLANSPPGFFVRSPASVHTWPRSQSVFEGEIAAFSINVEHGTSLQWYRNGSLLMGATNASLRMSSAVAAFEGSYQVSISNSLGMMLSSPVALSVKRALAMRRQVFERGSETDSVLIASAESALFETFQWSIDGVALPPVLGPRLRLAEYPIQFGAVGDVSCVISNVDGLKTNLIGRIIETGSRSAFPQLLETSIGLELYSHTERSLTGEASLGLDSSGRTTAFRWMPREDGLYGVSASGPNVECLVSVYEEMGESLQGPVASSISDHTFLRQDLNAVFEGKSGRSYRILVDGMSGDYGRFVLRIQKQPQAVQRGAEIWMSRFDGREGGHDRPADLAADSQGNIFAAGTVEDKEGWHDFVVLKYAPDGTRLWVSYYGGEAGPSDDWAAKLVPDEAGGCFITGLSRKLPEQLSYDTAHFGANGERVWSHRWPIATIAEATPTAIKRLPDGGVHVVGPAGVLRYGSEGALLGMADTRGFRPSVATWSTNGEIFLAGVNTAPDSRTPLLGAPPGFVVAKLDRELHRSWSTFQPFGVDAFADTDYEEELGWQIPWTDSLPLRTGPPFLVQDVLVSDAGQVHVLLSLGLRVAFSSSGQRIGPIWRGSNIVPDPGVFSGGPVRDYWWGTETLGFDGVGGVIGITLFLGHEDDLPDWILAKSYGVQSNGDGWVHSETVRGLPRNQPSHDRTQQILRYGTCFFILDKSGIRKLDPNGNQLWKWSHEFPSMTDPLAPILRVDRSGGLYALIAHKGLGRSFDDLALIRVVETGAGLPAPVVISQPKEESFQVGQTGLTSVRVEASGEAPLHYQWLGGGTPMTDQTNDTLLLGPRMDVSATKSPISVVISNRFGTTQALLTQGGVNPAKPTSELCLTVDFGLTRNEPAPIRRFVGEDALLDAGEAVSPTSTCFLQWFYEGNPVPGSNLSQLLLTNLNQAHSGAYWLQVSNLNGRVAQSRPYSVQVLQRTLSIDSFGPELGPEKNRAAMPWSLAPLVREDGAGSVVVAGRASTNEGGPARFAIAKFDPMARLLWSQIIGQTSVSQDAITAVHVDDAGGITAAGISVVTEPEHRDQAGLWRQVEIILTPEPGSDTTMFEIQTSYPGGVILDDISLTEEYGPGPSMNLLADPGFELPINLGAWNSLGDLAGSREIGFLRRTGTSAIQLGASVVSQTLDLPLQTGRRYRLELWFYCADSIDRWVTVSTGFGGGARSIELPGLPVQRSEPGYYMGAVRLSPEGKLLWTRYHRMTQTNDIAPRIVIASRSGGVYVVSPAATIKLDDQGLSAAV